MFNIGGGELLVIVLLALIVLGPQRLPDAMRTVGRVVGEVRRISSGFQQELRDAFEDSDVAAAASTPRRRESVPLAAAVADADADADASDAADPVDAADPAVDATSGEAPEIESSGIAPVVAEALESIVDDERAAS
ncbi:MAG: Sec-independent protein translocase protein TatB [Acidimicrobiales bacterium]